MIKIRKNNLDGYEQWVNQMDWTWFCTFTTGYELTLKSGRRLMNRYHERLTNYCGQPPILLWVGEPNEMRDGFHLHGLMKVNPMFTDKIHYRNFIDIYQSCVGNKLELNNGGKLTWKKWNRLDLQKYNPKRNAGKYCLKYIVKNASSSALDKNLSDYDILT